MNGNDEPIQTRMADQQAAAEFQQAHPNRTTSSAGHRAIKLTNDEPKSNKKWLVIALVALGIVGVIGIVVAAVMGSVNNKNTIDSEDALSQYKQLLINGTVSPQSPETINDAEVSNTTVSTMPKFEEDGEWYFFNLNTDEQIDNATLKMYLTELEEKFYAYQRSMNVSNSSEFINNYAELLHLMILFYNLSNIEVEIADSKTQDMSTYVSALLSTENNSGIIGVITENFSEYLESDVELFTEYNQRGCAVEDSEINYTCLYDSASELDSAKNNNNFLAQRSQQYLTLSDSIQLSQNTFRAWTMELPVKNIEEK